jgi:type II secretory pathway pseudopilin PulG
MQLRGQHGYAMVVLLVGMSVAAVLMSAAMPVWKQSVQREKESELIFRGQQYVRAIGLFQKRAGPGVLPPNVDVLVTNRFLRKKFKDPITGQDFDLLSPVQQGTPQGAQPGANTQAGRGAAPPAPAPSGAVVSGTAQAPAGGRGAAAGIMGVVSKSKDASIRLYNGRTHYNEWQFLYVAQTQAPGAGAPGGRGAAPPQGGQPPNGFGGVGGGANGRGGRGGPPPPGQGGGRGVSQFPPPSGAGSGSQGTPPSAPPRSPFAPRR